MGTESARFIGEQVEVQMDAVQGLEKKPACPQAFTWRGESFTVRSCLSEWVDFSRRGRSARNMRPPHASAAESRGSWGVGRFYFRVRVEAGRVFDLYYDRAPQDADHRKGTWYLFRELEGGS